MFHSNLFCLFFFYYHCHYFRGGVKWRGNKPWQISHMKWYDVVLTDMNISDLCVCTGLPVKHFRSLVHKMCSDIGRLHTNKQSSEYTFTCSPGPRWDGRYQNQNLKFPSGGITYVLGAFSQLIYKMSSRWRAVISLLIVTVAAPSWQSMFF